MQAQWYEVWADETVSSFCPYILVVVADLEKQVFSVINPQENKSVIFQSPDYEVVKLWLLEDEYTRVEGRMSPVD